MPQELIGSQQLLNEVAGRFRMKGTSLNQWCKNNGIALSNACTYMLGKRNGPVAKEWRRRIVDAARGPMKKGS